MKAFDLVVLKENQDKSIRRVEITVGETTFRITCSDPGEIKVNKFSDTESSTITVRPVVTNEVKIS